MTRLLLAAALVAAVAVGAWALFLRSPDWGHPLLVGALEDAVKFPQPDVAGPRIALGAEAGFNALDVTTAWKPGLKEPDPGELAILRTVAAQTRQRGMRLLITVYALRPRDAPFRTPSRRRTPRSSRRSRATSPASTTSPSGTSRT